MSFAIDPYLKKISELVQESSFTLLRAEPGSGKTTRVPVALSQVFKQRIVVLQPRRIAAIGPAQFVADCEGVILGHKVGYQVRFDSCYQPDKTQILYMTEGIFLKQILSDSLLSHIDVVVLDEFHERSVAGDFILAWLKKSIALAKIKTRVLIMSATINELELLDYLPGQLKVIDVPGKQFPLEVVYDKKPLSLRTEAQWYTRVEEKVREVASQSPQESILVFVPGRGEAEGLKTKLGSSLAKTHICFTLHGQMNLADQRVVLQPSRYPKVIFATNVAESSITLSGVSRVIDCGLERRTQWGTNNQVSELLLSRITLANHRQRAGRAAREKAGQAHVLWTKSDELSMPAQMIPEILKTDLRYWYLLNQKVQETFEGQSLDWLTPPLAANWDHLAAELEQRRLLENDQVSDLAELCLRLPFDFDGAYWLACAAEQEWFPHLLPLIIFILESKGASESVNPFELEDDPLFNCESDWNHWRRHRVLVQLAKEFNINSEDYSQLTFEKFSVTYDRYKTEFWKHYLSLFPNRLAQRRKTSGYGQKVLLASGTGAVVHKNSWVKKSPYLLVWQLVSLQGELVVTQAVGLSNDWVCHHLAFLMNDFTQSKEDHQNAEFEWVTKAKKINSIVVTEHSEKIKKNNLKNFKKIFLADPISCLQDNKEAQQWLIRWLNYTQISNKNNLMPDLLELVLIEAQESESFKSPYEKFNWISYFESMLDYNELMQFKTQMLESWVLPSGKKILLEYQLNQAPQCQVLLRDLYGVNQHPLILGRHPVRVTILGPHRRPIQITQEISQFWLSSYPQIKKEMRGRYPKQPWPEDPSKLIL